MSSLMNKIKDALHGDDGGSSGHVATAGERDATTSGHHAHDSSQVPGSFPASDQGGRDYVAPHGTGVGGQGQSRTHDSGFHQGRSGLHEVGAGWEYESSVSKGDRLGQATASHHHPRGEVKDDDKLMDPSDSGTGANILSGAGHGDHSSGPDKLHRRDNPTSHEINSGISSTDPGAYQGQGQHLREKISDPHQSARDGSHTGAFSTGGAGAGLETSQIADRSRQHDQTNEPHGARGGLDQHKYGGASDFDRAPTGGIYNSVIGHGSGEEDMSSIGRSGPGHPTEHPNQFGTQSGIASDHSQRKPVPHDAGEARISGRETGAAGAAGLAGAGAGAYGASHTRRDNGQQDNPGYGGFGHGLAQDNSAFPQSGGTGHDGQGAMARNSNAIPGSTSSGLGSHTNTKVMHTCSHCGQDNDISEKIKKELATRMGQ